MPHERWLQLEKIISYFSSTTYNIEFKKIEEEHPTGKNTQSYLIKYKQKESTTIQASHLGMLKI